jgi:hypothetical protein
MRNGAIMITALAIAACADASEEPIASGSGTASLGGSVTYKYESDVGEAAAKAASYCAKYRKRAWLRSTGGAGDEKFATYDCR